MQKQLSVVIPFYNEEKNIAIVFKALLEIVSANPFIEVVLVDNGSTDNSAAVFAQIFASVNTRDFILVTIPVNKGYGHGIKIGLGKATADILSWTHADLQTDPGDILKALDLYKAANEDKLLVKGKRKNRNPFDNFFTWGMQVYCYFKLGENLKDINAQPKLFSRVFFDCIHKNMPDDFSLDLYVLYMAKKIGRVQTFDVFFKKRLFGSAKGGGTLKGKWKLIRRTIQYVNHLSETIKK